jgi:CBS domain-containing protein
MQVNQVRRLPVIKEDGILEGVLSMNDVVLNAEESKDKKKADLSYSDVVNAYKSICEHRVPTRVKAMARG